MIYREFAIKNLEGGVQDPHQDAQELAHEAQVSRTLANFLNQDAGLCTEITKTRRFGNLNPPILVVTSQRTNQYLR